MIDDLKLDAVRLVELESELKRVTTISESKDSVIIKL